MNNITQLIQLVKKISIITLSLAVIFLLYSTIITVPLLSIYICLALIISICSTHLISMLYKKFSCNQRVPPSVNSSSIKVAKKLGYNINSEGLCYGIAHLAVQETLKGGRRGLENFMLIINMIQSSKDTISGQDLVDVKAFFDNVCIYQNIGAVPKDFAKGIKLPPKQDYAASSAILGYNLMSQQSIIKTGLFYFGLFYKKDFDSLLKQNCIFTIDCTFAINRPGHMLAVVSIDNDFFLIDHDNVKKLSRADLINYLSTRYRTLLWINQFKGPQINRALADKVYKQAIQTRLQSLMLIPPAINNCATIVKEFMNLVLASNLSEHEKIKLITSQHTADKNPVLTNALRHGNSQVIQIYVTEILNSNLGMQAKLDILAARVQGIPGVILSIGLGYHESTKVYFDSLSKQSPSLYDTIVAEVNQSISSTINTTGTEAQSLSSRGLHLLYSHNKSGGSCSSSRLLGTFQHLPTQVFK